MSPEDYEQIRIAFVESSAMSPADRAAFLNDLRDNSPTICREVESLLRHDTSQTFVAVDKSQPTKPVNAGDATVAVSRSSSRTSRRRRLITRPLESRPTRRMLLLACLMATFFAGAVWLQGLTQQSIDTLVGDMLDGVAEAQSSLLKTWFAGAGFKARSWAATDEVRQVVETIIAESDPQTMTPEELAASSLHADLEVALAAVIQRTLGDDYEVLEDLRYAVWNRERELLVDWSRNPKFFGQPDSDSGATALAKVFRGGTSTYIPNTGVYTNDYEFVRPPELAFTVPVYNSNGRIIAAMLIGGMFQEHFEEAMQTSDFGESAESYAINQSGLFVSGSRFTDQLKTIGLISEKNPTAALTLHVTDPQRDLRGTVTSTQDPDWPATFAASELSEKRSGRGMEPYRDYRGVSVVGAWRWIDEYSIGVISEIDAEEAFTAIDTIRGANHAITLLLGLGLAGAVFSAIIAWRNQAKKSQLPRIGAYTLFEKIGEGGMGEVYRATHDLLARPAAVKILKKEVSISPDMSARFEREVRLASSLESPHTIEIYDFGRTEDTDGGTSQFYCAMALLRGMTLRQLTRIGGPLPPSRVAYLMIQVCRSLGEAHDKGLVHRDIKPANIMVCDRGGVPDHVVVLDFGLAKELATNRKSDSNVTKTSMLLGTPEFIAPERIRHPNVIDPRSDLYALGVVMNLLLTGESVFETTSELETLEKTLYAEPRPPSSLQPSTGISLAFDELVLSCLRKDVAERPKTATHLLDLLHELVFDTPWTERDARKWWDENESSI